MMGRSNMPVPSAQVRSQATVLGLSKAQRAARTVKRWLGEFIGALLFFLLFAAVFTLTECADAAFAAAPALYCANCFEPCEHGVVDLPDGAARLSKCCEAPCFWTKEDALLNWEPEDMGYEGVPCVPVDMETRSES